MGKSSLLLVDKMLGSHFNHGFFCAKEAMAQPSQEGKDKFAKGTAYQDDTLFEPLLPEQESNSHYHLEYEIIKVISGLFKLSYRDQIYCLKPGDYAFIGAGELHVLSPSDCDPNKDQALPQARLQAAAACAAPAPASSAVAVATASYDDASKETACTDVAKHCDGMGGTEGAGTKSSNRTKDGDVGEADLASAGSKGVSAPAGDEASGPYVYQSLYFDLAGLPKQMLSLSDFMDKLNARFITIDPVIYRPSEGDSPIKLQLEELFSCIKDAWNLQQYSHTYESYARRSALDLMALGEMMSLLGLIQLEQKYSSYEDSLSNYTKSALDKSTELMRYITEHYCENLTLDELAKVVDLQPNYFCRYFKVLTGQRPFDYINKLRLDEAAKRLLASNQSIFQIAYSCGFQDPCYFTRLFKKQMGLTPRQYRHHPSPTTATVAAASSAAPAAAGPTTDDT